MQSSAAPWGCRWTTARIDSGSPAVVGARQMSRTPSGVGRVLPCRCSSLTCTAVAGPGWRWGSQSVQRRDPVPTGCRRIWRSSGGTSTASWNSRASSRRSARAVSPTMASPPLADRSITAARRCRRCRAASRSRSGDVPGPTGVTTSASPGSSAVPRRTVNGAGWPATRSHTLGHKGSNHPSSSSTAGWRSWSRSCSSADRRDSSSSARESWRRNSDARNLRFALASWRDSMAAATT